MHNLNCMMGAKQINQERHNTGYPSFKTKCKPTLKGI